MLSVMRSGHVWIATGPTDLRKSFDGLGGVVRSWLSGDPLPVDLFAFVGPQPHAVEDQEVGRGEAQHPLVVALVGARGAQRREHAVRRDMDDRMVRAAGTLADGLSQMRLADACGPDQERVLALHDEGPGRSTTGAPPPTPPTATGST